MAQWTVLDLYKSEVFHELYKPQTRISFTLKCSIKTIIFMRSLQPSFTCTGIFSGLVYYLYIQGVAIKKPDSCSNPLLKKSDNRNVIPFNVVPSPIPTLLHANFPLLEVVLQVILCYAVLELRRFCFHCIHGLEPGSFERRLDFREEKKVARC